MIAVTNHPDCSSAPLTLGGQDTSAPSAGSKSDFADLLQEVETGSSQFSDLTRKPGDNIATKKPGDANAPLALALSVIGGVVAPAPIPVTPATDAIVATATSSSKTTGDDVKIETPPCSSFEANAADQAGAMPSSRLPAATDTESVSMPAPSLISRVETVRGTKETGEVEEPKNGILLGQSDRASADVQKPLATFPAPQNSAPAPAELPSDAKVTTPAPTTNDAMTVIATSAKTTKSLNIKPQIGPRSNGKTRNPASEELGQAFTKLKDAKATAAPGLAREPSKSVSTQDLHGGSPRSEVSDGHSSNDTAQRQQPHTKIGAVEGDSQQPRSSQTHGSAEEAADAQPASAPGEHSEAAAGVINVAGTLPRAPEGFREPDGPGISAANIEPRDVPAATNSSVNLARLVTGTAQSEMHIGLRTTAFGTVEVHTVIRENQVGLSVGTERGDLKALLASEVPALRTALHHQDLHFEGIRFSGDSAGARSDSESGRNSEPRQSHPAWPQSAEVAAPEEVSLGAVLLETNAGHAGFSVHA